MTHDVPMETILGDDDVNYVDITFASIMGLWMQPDNYGAGVADAARVPKNELPHAMQNNIERWSEDYPRATAFVNRLYETERQK